MLSKILLASLIAYMSSYMGAGFSVDISYNQSSTSSEATVEKIVQPHKNSTSLGVDVGGKSAVVIDYNSGQTLFGINQNQKLPMASLTKVMTATVLLDSGISLDDTYVIEPEVLNMYGSDINLEVGEEVKVSDLLYGMLINSGNDAAIAIARKVAKDENKFVKMMNEKAKMLGMTNSNFQNPHGLDEKNHYTSASDLAKLAQYIYQKPAFKQIIRMKDYQFDAINITKTHHLKNTNDLLQDDYFMINGGKTGFTDNAGYCLIAYGIDDKKHKIITVVLGEPQDGQQFHDTKAMIEWTFGNYNWE